MTAKNEFNSPNARKNGLTDDGEEKKYVEEKTT